MMHPLGTLPQPPIGGPLGTGVHIQRAKTSGILLADRDLKLHDPLLIQHQRRMQNELPYTLDTKLAADMQRELQEGRTRQQYATHHHMIGNP
jgi:hypothetical protein